MILVFDKLECFTWNILKGLKSSLENCEFFVFKGFLRLNSGRRGVFGQVFCLFAYTIDVLLIFVELFRWFLILFAFFLILRKIRMLAIFAGETRRGFAFWKNPDVCRSLKDVLGALLCAFCWDWEHFFAFLRGLSWFLTFILLFYGGFGGILRSFLRFMPVFWLLVWQGERDFCSEVLKKSAFSSSKLAKYCLWLLFGAILMNCSAILAGFGIFLVVYVISNDFFLWLERFFCLFFYFFTVFGRDCLLLNGFWAILEFFGFFVGFGRGFAAIFLLFKAVRCWRGARNFLLLSCRLSAVRAAFCVLFCFRNYFEVVIFGCSGYFYFAFWLLGWFLRCFLTARAIFVRFLKNWLVLFTKH